MDIDKLTSTTADSLTVTRVFGAPISQDGTLVIPVAMVAGGWGGGERPSGADTGPETGSGSGGLARPLGVYVLRDGKVRWVPAVNATLVAITALIVVRRLVEGALLRRLGRAG